MKIYIITCNRMDNKESWIDCVISKKEDAECYFRNKHAGQNHYLCLHEFDVKDEITYDDLQGPVYDDGWSDDDDDDDDCDYDEYDYEQED